MNMSNNRKVLVTISPLGVPKVEAQNFYGASCEAATSGIEKALAAGEGGVLVRDHKAEYYEEGQDQQATETQSW